MSDNKQVLVVAPVTDGICLSDTHHLLKILLIELGEPWKSADEDTASGDFIYFSTKSWSGVLKRAAGLAGCDDIVAKIPDDWAKGSTTDLLFNKAFVRQYYQMIADEVAKEARKTGSRIWATDDIFSDKNLGVILKRAGAWKG